MKTQFSDEYEGAELGDARRSKRLVKLGLALGAYPSLSFPRALGSNKTLEAAYRFLGNPAVEWTKILQPHVRETRSRCVERETVIVAHDTSDFVFGGEKRRELGRMRGCKERGFFAHTALAVSWDAYREPLGVLHLETWTRGEKKTGSQRTRSRDPNRESTRWFRGVEAVENGSETWSAVHVMDREADSYELITAMIEANYRFVIRSTFDRRVKDGTLMERIASQPIRVTREVPLSTRKGSAFPAQRRIHPPRNSRMATLGIKAGAVRLLRPGSVTATFPKSIEIHVVLVEEISPPAGQPAVMWRLYTTEPIETAADIERVVDAYRCRWRIEELFKALKSGCAIERRQLETGRALQNALALYIPIAWRVLRHRTLAISDHARPAATILTKTQIQILRRMSNPKLPETLTVADSLIAIAALGGHLKRNGSPGWMTLAYGYERLLTLEQGALLAAEGGCDQS